MIINKQEISLATAKRNRRHETLTQLMAIIKSLAERNLAFRGSANTLSRTDNKNFSKGVEFKTVIKELYVSREKSKTIVNAALLFLLVTHSKPRKKMKIKKNLFFYR